MGEQDGIERGLPKKKLAAGVIGLTLTVGRLIAESMMRSMTDAVIGGIAIISLVVIAIGIIGFIGAYEYQKESTKQEIGGLKTQLSMNNTELLDRCEQCSFSHQSNMVGTSDRHYKEMTEQREFYEDYITAVLYTFNEVIVRLAKSEASMEPLIHAILESPMYKTEQTEDLKIWKNFLTNLANGLSSNKTRDSTQRTRRNS